MLMMPLWQYCAPLGTATPTLSETIDAFEKLLRRVYFTYSATLSAFHLTLQCGRLLQVNPSDTPLFVAEVTAARARR